MTTRDELIAPYLDGLTALAGVIKDRDLDRRFEAINRVHSSIIPVLGPLLVDKDFNPGVYLTIIVHAFANKSISELGITTLDNASFNRAGALGFALVKPENNDLFSKVDTDRAGKAYDALRLAALIATDEELQQIIANLRAVSSLVVDRGADHREIIAILPTISRTPSLTSGAL